MNDYQLQDVVDHQLQDVVGHHTKDNNDSPTLSVIIPLYNCQRFICQCLDSIYAQGMEDCEVIVVDDGSTDNSRDLVAGYAVAHTNLVLINQENSGVAMARNTAIECARGKYITFVDADDMLVDGSLRRLVDIAKSYDADMVKAWHKKVPEDAMAEGYECLDDGAEGYGCYADGAVRVMSGDEAIVKETKLDEGYCWGYLIRSSVIKAYAIRFPEGVMFMEDWAFITQVMVHAQCFVVAPLLYYLYRDNASSCVANMTMGKLLSGCRSIDTVCRLASETNGEMRVRLTENICFNINIILWFMIHYSRIFAERKAIMHTLKSLLKMVDASLVPARLKVFNLVPNLYVMALHAATKRKY